MFAKASGTVPSNVADESPEFHIERLEAYTDKVPLREIYFE